MLGLRRTGDTEGGVEFFFGAGLEQQGDNHDRQEFPLTFPGLDLREPDLPDPGVKDGFEFLARGRIGKNDPSQFAATKMAGLIEKVMTESSRNFAQSRLAGLDQVAGEEVGIDDRDAAPGEQFRRGRSEERRGGE